MYVVIKEMVKKYFFRIITFLNDLKFFRKYFFSKTLIIFEIMSVLRSIWITLVLPEYT